MSQTTILTQKRHAHVYRNNLYDSLRQSLPVLSKHFLSTPKHTYSSLRAKDYRPLGSAIEEFPLPHLVKQTMFTDPGPKDEREPGVVLRVNVYPTMTGFRSLEGVSVEVRGTPKRFCEELFGTVDPRPELMNYIRSRLMSSPLTIMYALLNEQKRWINEWQEICLNSERQKHTKSIEDSSDRLDKVMSEGEQRKQDEVEEEDDPGEAGDDEMEEDEGSLNKADNKKNRGGKKSQRARLEKKLRKAKEEKEDAKLEERNRRPLRSSPPQSDAATLGPGVEFEDEGDWIVYSDKRTRPSRVVDTPSALKEEFEEAAQEPVIKLAPAISNTDEQALLSRDFNVQDSNLNAPPDQSLEESLPSPVIRLPPSPANREDDFQETPSSPVVRLPPSAANREDGPQETFSSPVEQPSAFAASKEIYSGLDQEFAVVRLPSYGALSTPKMEDAGEWDEVSCTKDKSEVEQAETPSPSQSDTRDTQSQAPQPLFPGTRRDSPVQTSEASPKTDAASQIQEEEMSETLSAISNDEQLEVQESISPTRSGTRRDSPVQTSEASPKLDAALQIQEEDMSETLSAIGKDEQLEVQESISPTRSGTRRDSPVQTSEAHSKTDDAASQVQEEDMSELLSAFSNDEQVEVQKSMSPSQSGTLRHSPVQASEASSTTHVASQIQEEDMSKTLSPSNDDEQLDTRERIRESQEALTEELRQMHEEYEAKHFSKYYDAASHSSQGNRRASDPGPFSPHFRQTTPSDHRPAPLGLSSGLDDQETAKSVESESAKGEETSSPNPGQTLIPPLGPGPADPQNILPSQSTPNPQNPPQNVYHQPYYQYPQPLQYDPAFTFHPIAHMGFYGQYPQQQMYGMPLALNQQHLFDPNQPAMLWPNYHGTYPGQENPAQENTVQENSTQENPTQGNPSYPHHWQ